MTFLFLYNTGFLASLEAAAGLTTSSLLNRADTATLDDVVLRNAPDDSTAKQIRDGIHTLDQAGYVEFKNIGGHRVRVAHIALSQLADVRQLPFHNFRESVNSISTYFNINPDDAYELYVAAELLMKDRYGDRLSGLVREIDAKRR